MQQAGSLACARVRLDQRVDRHNPAGPHGSSQHATFGAGNRLDRVAVDVGHDSFLTLANYQADKAGCLVRAGQRAVEHGVRLRHGVANQVVSAGLAGPTTASHEGHGATLGFVHALVKHALDEVASGRVDLRRAGAVCAVLGRQLACNVGVEHPAAVGALEAGVLGNCCVEVGIDLRFQFGTDVAARSTDVGVACVKAAVVSGGAFDLLWVEGDKNLVPHAVRFHAAATNVGDAVKAHGAQTILHCLGALVLWHLFVSQHFFDCAIPALVGSSTLVVLIDAVELRGPCIGVRHCVHVQRVLDRKKHWVDAWAGATALGGVAARHTWVCSEVPAHAHQAIVRCVGIEVRKGVTQLVCACAVINHERLAFCVNHLAATKPALELSGVRRSAVAGHQSVEAIFLGVKRLASRQVCCACRVVDCDHLFVRQDAVDLHRSTDQPVASHVRVGLVAIEAVLWNLVRDVRVFCNELSGLVDAALCCLVLPSNIVRQLDFSPHLVCRPAVWRRQRGV